MKWVFYVIVFVYMGYRAVYGAKVNNEISIEKINYGNDTFFSEGSRRSIICKGSNRNQRLEWVDPFGKVVTRVLTNRLYTQERVTSPNGRSLALIFTDLLAKDTGEYTCRSGSIEQHVPVCVIKPAEFVDTPTEVVIALGRSISLTCQAKGNPEPTIYWERDLEELTEENETSKYKVNTKYNVQGYESILTITDLEPQDSGKYICVARQEHSLANCVNTEETNITLLVSHGPIFENENDTKAVYGELNEIVDLVCSARGHPTPTYRWFKVQNDNVLAEFDQKQIKYSEEENLAILSVTASHTTFGNTYKCVASNVDGDSEKYFQLFELEKPEKPYKVKLSDSTDSTVELNVIWLGEIDFPVKGFQVQYLQDKRKHRGLDWKKADETYVDVEKDFDSESSVIVKDLEEDTSYWVRVKPINNAGEGPWSDAVFVETTVKSEEPEEETVAEPVAAEVSSDSTFYGIFFAGGIAVVAVACMFFMRMV